MLVFQDMILPLVHVESVLMLLLLIGKWLIRRITLQSAVPVAIFQSLPVQLLGSASSFHRQSQTGRLQVCIMQQQPSLDHCEQLRNIDQPLRYQFSTGL